MSSMLVQVVTLIKILAAVDAVIFTVGKIKRGASLCAASD